MSISAKAFIIVFAALIFLFVVADRWNLRSDVKDRPEFVMQLDTAAIVEIHSVSQADPHHDLHLERRHGSWHVVGDSAVSGTIARQVLGAFQRLKVKRTMGSLLEFGDRFELRPHSMRTVEFITLNGEHMIIHVGSDTFGATQNDVWTYVHLPGGTDVFAVEAPLHKVLDGAAPL